MGLEIVVESSALRPHVDVNPSIVRYLRAINLYLWDISAVVELNRGTRGVDPVIIGDEAITHTASRRV